jgi:predicted dehydrogenase
MPTRESDNKRVRYAVVGLGHIAQVAVLPAFAHAKNSELTALVSDDPVKLRALSRKYKVARTYGYEQYEECLASGDVDAVYIALPNHLHSDYSVRAAQQGVHVLCEKPMAVTERECEMMMAASDRYRTRLMVAYRLHFEAANLEAVEIARSGKLGTLRLFNSSFTMKVEEGNIRLDPRKGGGTLYDIGIYCINAARYLFGEEPIEAWSAIAGSQGGVEKSSSVVLRFPGDRLASFVCSFDAADVSAYELIGTDGVLRVDPAYEYAGERRHVLTVKGRTRERVFPKSDQFAPEVVYFSDCILKDEEPEPSGEEGLADVRLIRSLYQSANTGKPVSLRLPRRSRRPGAWQLIERPPVRKPETVHARAPSGH